MSEFMRRNRFDELLRFLHLTNNDGLDGPDSLCKVRQLFYILNASFKQVSPGKCASIDESMFPYYGRQFIREMPVRFGFELWVAADPSGFIFHAEPYCGSSTRLPETGLGQGSNVPLGMVAHSDGISSVVTVLTNYHPVDPMRKSSRYSRADRKKISVNVPGPVAQYNNNMGGVDIGDQFIATYITASILRTNMCSRMASVS
ncbi:hypothetical protein ANN_26737 [Periplaneta americana]|uniref:PiggyBac transposable element-derived protein domain-containing protein n=1 Tax=Periplaneta americana TaxID=6978 RepID=A0ABQ8RZ14_PERAM|nr:hypothetical protein ANN_26737 [Periplaneta americana]